MDNYEQMESQNKSEKELLAEIARLQKSSARRSLAAVIIAGVCALVLIIGSIIVIPRTVKLMNRANELAVEAEIAVHNIDSIDINSLNQSIHSLSDILQPLASFFSAFK